MERRDDIIKSPCDQDFASMRDEGARRFCESCSCYVHDFSKMTRVEVTGLVERALEEGGELCARIRWRGDEIVFAPSRPERERDASLQKV